MIASSRTTPFLLTSLKCADYAISCLYLKNIVQFPYIQAIF